MKHTCSVIVPLYRGKDYIKACIDSIAAQTLPCHELILMDDGSPDDTYDFVATLLPDYPTLNARLLRQENRGVAETRNACMTLATGDYISFMDQDDCLAPDYLEKLMGEAERTDADIVLCGYIRRTDEGKILKTVTLTTDSFSKYRIVAPWARVYKKSFLLEHDLKFLTTPCGEDTYLTVRAYAMTDKITILSGYAGYVWRYNPSSVSNSKQKSVTIANAACDTFERLVAALPTESCALPADEEYFFVRACIFYLLFSSHAENSAQVTDAYNRYFGFLNTHFPHYRKHVRLRRPKGESFSVRFTVRFFVLLQKIGLAKCFAKLWSKISK